MKNKDTNLLAIIGILLMVPVSAIWNGFVIVRLWHWFIVSTFGITELTIMQGLGLSLVASLLTYNSAAAQNKDDSTAMVIARALLVPALFLLLGYIYSLFL
jgi:ABC-type Mn2+/Zn2+ transport system permease subunit